MQYDIKLKPEDHATTIHKYETNPSFLGCFVINKYYRKLVSRVRLCYNKPDHVAFRSLKLLVRQDVEQFGALG